VADEAGRVAILERLADFPSEYGPDFEGVARERVKNKAARGRLLRRRGERFPTS
jgi:hypothetical protein